MSEDWARCTGPPRLGRIGTPAFRPGPPDCLEVDVESDAKLPQGRFVTVQGTHCVNPIGSDAVSWPADSNLLQVREDGGPGDVEAGSQFTVGGSGPEGGDKFVDQDGAQPGF